MHESMRFYAYSIQKEKKETRTYKLNNVPWKFCKNFSASSGGVFKYEAAKRIEMKKHTLPIWHNWRVEKRLMRRILWCLFIAMISWHWVFKFTTNSSPPMDWRRQCLNLTCARVHPFLGRYVLAPREWYQRDHTQWRQEWDGMYWHQEDSLYLCQQRKCTGAKGDFCTGTEGYVCFRKQDGVAPGLCYEGDISACVVTPWWLR